MEQHALEQLSRGGEGGKGVVMCMSTNMNQPQMRGVVYGGGVSLQQGMAKLSKESGGARRTQSSQ